MLVAFDYECPNHGLFEKFLNTLDYPDRKFPLFFWCDKCATVSYMVLNTKGMQPDSYWSGKEIKSLGITVNSKDYLRRYCKTNGITQLTDEECKTTKHKTSKEITEEYMNRPDVARERMKSISESIDGYGVIDSVNMEK